MKKQTTCVAFLLSASLAMAANNQDAAKEVTSDYVVNYSFETDNLDELEKKTESSDGLRGYIVSAPYGWTLSGDCDKSYLVNQDCYTDNNFGKVTTVADGSVAYYLRRGWTAGQATLQQTLKNLPAGKYRLTADVRSAYNGSATSAFSLFAGDEKYTATFTQGSTGCFTSMKWTTQEVTFTVTASGDVNIGFVIDWVAGGSCITIDNVRLYQLSDSYVQPDDPTEEAVESPTEGVINNQFVGEKAMKDDLMAMLAKFAQYMKNDYQDCAAPNSVGEACGAFKSNSTMTNGEDGVRPNADLSMICAFLVKYGKDKVTLPENVTWDDLEQMAMKSLVYAYSTHKANKLKVCSGNNYWGSAATNDYVWESSLWAMSVAYSAFFQWDKLTDTQKGYIEKLLKAECNYELNRTIPTGYNGDTKAEENGWEADVLAATLGLFPNDELAPKWYERLREFAINCYSHKEDADDNTVIDPDYDKKTISDLYKGQNLFDDYTLQNHNFFHTSYQNVVIQELGEAALALKLFQQKTIGEEKWKTNALMHNNDKVMKEVLNWLALADGELAMPNGNDWSLFLYDQITSYSTNACFLGDPDALMLENLAYKYIKARQTTTEDGSWLLRSDVAARRMGVEGHRVMMTWLMHEAMPTADATPTDWDEFNQRYAAAKIFPCQNVVRAATDDRFTCFSWSAGKQSYTGYIAANSADKNKIVVPYRENNTGNFLGWYQVSGKGTNATPAVSGIYDLRGNSYTMNGELKTNDGTLDNRFAIYSTPGNAVIYTDYVRANAAATVTKEQGGLMAISTDELTRNKRTLYYADGNESETGMTHKQSDGSSFMTINSNWVNVDNALGIVNLDGTRMAFGDRANNNSIMTSKLYASYSDESRQVKAGEVVGKRNIVYYSNVDAASTKAVMEKSVSLKDKMADGWNGAIATDPSGASYMLVANFCGDSKCVLKDVQVNGKAPVLSVDTKVTDSKSEATYALDANHSKGEILGFGIDGSDLMAVQDSGDSTKIYVSNLSETANKFSLTYTAKGITYTSVIELGAEETKSVQYSSVTGEYAVEDAEYPEGKTDVLDGYTDVTADKLVNASFEEDNTYANANGNVTLSGVTYNPCYVNEVKAADSKFANVLPVTGWTTAKTLEGSSAYCRMYSMPYSTSLYCVSPSNVGNYSAQCAAPALDGDCGGRCLTVLNSWSKGKNSIVQNVKLPAGDYRLVFDMKYECANQVSNDGKVVKTSGNNDNVSFTGIKIGEKTDYRYPSVANEWEQMIYDFTLDKEQEVEVSLGFSTSTGAGAANNTLLYIDNVRLGAKYANSIQSTQIAETSTHGNIYSLGGMKVKSPSTGVYVVDGRKIVFK